MFKLKKEQGFSLIELLIIIIIIILLAGISIIALNGQRAKARDAKRISDIKQIQTVLEFYYSDEGEYPQSEQPLILGSVNAVKLCSKAEGGFVSKQTECSQETIYMSSVPQDPLTDKQFTYTGTAEGYDIIFSTERETVYGPAGIYHAHSEGIDTIPGNR